MTHVVNNIHVYPIIMREFRESFNSGDLRVNTNTSRDIFTIILIVSGVILI